MFRSATAVLISLAVCIATRAQPPAQDAAEPPPLIDVGKIEIPQGDADQVIAYLNELTELRQRITREYQQTIGKISAAQAEASAEVLDQADRLSDAQFIAAARHGLSGRVRNLRQAGAEQQERLLELVRRQISIGLKDGLQRGDVSNATMLAAYLERYGEGELALRANRSLADLLKQSKSSSYRRYADRMEATARRLALIGNPLELEGKLVDGTPFRWSDYEGKVVLVDFWATWCGPCLAEAPNVRKNYDQYHDRGFEVVGISLDTKKQALQSYLKKNNVPWANLFQDGAGWKHPMAVKYGIQAIPTVFLVDRDGKVVSLRARGAELGKQLKALLGTPEDYRRAIESLDRQLAETPNDANLLARRAEAYLATDQIEAAVEDWNRAAELKPDLLPRAISTLAAANQFDAAVPLGNRLIAEKPDEALPFVTLAGLLVAQQDSDAMRKLCDRMIEQFGSTKDSREARLVCKVCSLIPDGPKADRLPQKVFHDSFKSPSTAGYPPWSLGIRGLVALRGGDAGAAVKDLEQALENRYNALAVANNLPMLAMAYQADGQTEAAQKTLDEAVKKIESLRSDPDTRGHHDTLIAAALLQQAQKSIGTKSP